MSDGFKKVYNDVSIFPGSVWTSIMKYMKVNWANGVSYFNTIYAPIGSTSGGASMPFTTASGTDTYTANFLTQLTSIAKGQAISVFFTNANSTSCTINIAGFSTYSLLKFADAPFVYGDIKAGQILIFIFDGTNFQCQSVTSNIAQAL